MSLSHFQAILLPHLPQKSLSSGISAPQWGQVLLTLYMTVLDFFGELENRCQRIVAGGDGFYQNAADAQQSVAEDAQTHECNGKAAGADCAVKELLGFHGDTTPCERVWIDYTAE